MEHDLGTIAQEAGRGSRARNYRKNDGGNNHRNRRRCQQRKNIRRPPSAIEKAVCDCLYGIKYVPAKWKGKAISFVATLPVIFN